MPYSIRNTIILLTTFLLLMGSGLSYIHFVLDEKIESHKSVLSDKEKELAELEKTVSQFDNVQQTLDEAKQRLENYPKALFPNGRHSIIYGFLNRVNQGNANIQTDIIARKNNSEDSYGILTTGFEGVGYFSNLYRFIAAVEKSKPINRFTKIEIRGINTLENLGKVNLHLQLESYYELSESNTGRTNVLQINVENLNLRSKPSIQSEIIHKLNQGQNVEIISEDPNWVRVAAGNNIGWISNMYVKPVEYAPLLEIRQANQPVYSALFYPMIHDIPPNDENLLNIEQSKLIGVSKEKIFVLDDKQNMHELQIGDDVYLGSLRYIDQKKQTATFVLNKGGIVEKFFLQINQNSEKKE